MLSFTSFSSLLCSIPIKEDPLSDLLSLKVDPTDLPLFLPQTCCLDVLERGSAVLAVNVKLGFRCALHERKTLDPRNASIRFLLSWTKNDEVVKAVSLYYDPAETDFEMQEAFFKVHTFMPKNFGNDSAFESQLANMAISGTLHSFDQEMDGGKVLSVLYRTFLLLI